MKHYLQHRFRSFLGSSFLPSRFVYDKKEAQEMDNEQPEKKDVGKMDKVELKAEYQKARDEVRDTLKKYEGKKAQYKVFIDYANQRLNQVDTDLQRFDVLEPKQIRDNLKKLRNILEFAADEQLQERKKDIVGLIENKRKAMVKKLEDRYKEHVGMLESQVKPNTLKFARSKFIDVRARMNLLFNARIRGVESSISKQFNTKWDDAQSRTDTIMMYLDDVEAGLTTSDKNSTAGDAEALYQEYEDGVRGEFCLEEAKQGVIEAKIKQTCLQYMVDYRDKDMKVYKLFDNLQKKYVDLLAQVKGEDAYKVQAILYGQFLDEVRNIRSVVLKENDKVVGKFGDAAADQVDAGRKPGEKNWDKIERQNVQLVDFHPKTEYVMKKGEALHYLATDGLPESANGVVIDYAKQGTTVLMTEDLPVKVNGLSYVHVQTTDKQGKVTADGWVRADAVNTKFGIKKEDAVEKRKGETEV